MAKAKAKAKHKKSSRRAFVPRALFQTVCVTTVVPLCAISACGNAGRGSLDGGSSAGSAGYYGVAAGGFAGVGAGGFMGVAAGGFMGVAAGGFMGVAAGGFAGGGAGGTAGGGGTSGNGGFMGVAAGGFMGVAAGGFGGNVNDAATDADASDGSAMLDTPTDESFGELAPAPDRRITAKRKRRT